jgi:hypothetical protein
MSKFRIGDQCTKKDKAPFVVVPTNRPSINPPVFGKIYTVSDIWQYKSQWYIELTELNKDSGYNENEFEKVVSDSVLSEELESVPEPFTI